MSIKPYTSTDIVSSYLKAIDWHPSVLFEVFSSTEWVGVVGGRHFHGWGSSKHSLQLATFDSILPFFPISLEPPRSFHSLCAFRIRIHIFAVFNNIVILVLFSSDFSTKTTELFHYYVRYRFTPDSMLTPAYLRYTTSLRPTRLRRGSAYVVFSSLALMRHNEAPYFRWVRSLRSSIA